MTAALDWLCRFELGVSYDLKSEVSVARLGARKSFQLGNRKGPWLKIRTDADFDIQRQKVTLRDQTSSNALQQDTQDGDHGDGGHAAICKGACRADKGHL